MKPKAIKIKDQSLNGIKNNSESESGFANKAVTKLIEAPDITPVVDTTVETTSPSFVSRLEIIFFGIFLVIFITF